MTAAIDFKAFGKNDIRGIYGAEVTEEIFYYTGRGFVKYIEEKTGLNPDNIAVTVSRDARLHSKSLADVLIKGILHAGAHVFDLGLAPTPLGYYSEFASFSDENCGDVKITGALIVTASHNPPEYNGLKMTFNKSSLNEEQIKEVKKWTEKEAQEGAPAYAKGSVCRYDIIQQYSDFILSKFEGTFKNITVVTDCANGTAGVIAPKLYSDAGCRVIELYTEPDGHFPNHHPNPSDLSTLKALRKKVIETGADLGIAFDGDSDRIGVIDSEGNPLSGDRLLYIYAQDIIKDLALRGEHPAVISEVKCSQILFDEINKLGGRAVMAKTGHGCIKSAMKENDAILAGEMSGHMFFKDRYYGYDDAIYAGCRIMQIIAEHKAENPDFKLSDLLVPFKKVYSSDEIRYKCPNELKAPVLEAFENEVKKDKNVFKSPILDIVTIDGMRIIFSNGFALIRKSNTEPVFTLRFEAQDEKTALRYRDIMTALLDKCMDEISNRGEK